MTNVAKLKGKGAPPALEQAPRNTELPPREKSEAMKPLQVRVPESVFEAFSERAGKEFGYSKGGKSALFLKMWEAYRKQT